MASLLIILVPNEILTLARIKKLCFCTRECKDQCIKMMNFLNFRRAVVMAKQNVRCAGCGTRVEPGKQIRKISFEPAT